MRRWMFTPRSARWLVAVLLGLKLLLLAWNAVSYDGDTYNPGHHSDRAMFGGLKVGKFAYDGPLYYLPGLLVARPESVTPRERYAGAASSETVDAPTARKAARQSKAERAYRARLLDVLRYSNLLWITFFYLAWICYALPRLLGFQGWFLVSLLLLAMPGYQKLAAMSHPDNLFAAASALAVCGWLSLRERWTAASAASVAARPPWALLGFVLSIVLLAWTRPMALAPVAALSVVALVYTARLAGGGLRRSLPRVLGVSALIVVLGGAWYGLRWQRTGAVTDIYHAEFLSHFEPRRVGFSYAHYFGSFHRAWLLEHPNLTMADAPLDALQNSPHANSFFTLLHSEIWGDHWLSFSGKKEHDIKIWAKRLSLGTALIVPIVCAVLVASSFAGLLGSWQASWRAAGQASLTARLRRVVVEHERELTLLGWTLLGWGLFVWWQAGPALLPGSNSTIKFVYVATLFPPTLALLFGRPLPRLAFSLLTAYLFVVYAAAFPFAMFWPS